MKFFTIALAAALATAPATAYAWQDAQPAPPEAETPGEPIAAADSFDLARAKIDGCPGERFDFEIADAPTAKGTKVSLCSKQGASNADIARMLRSAITQLEATDRMAPLTREQLVALIRTKIAEVEAR